MSTLPPAWRPEQNPEQLTITPNVPFTHRDPAVARAILQKRSHTGVMAMRPVIVWLVRAPTHKQAIQTDHISHLLCRLLSSIQATSNRMSNIAFRLEERHIMRRVPQVSMWTGFRLLGNKCYWSLLPVELHRRFREKKICVAHLHYKQTNEANTAHANGLLLSRKTSLLD